MEELETPDPDYLKGFNEGHIMAEKMPDLTDKLVEALGNSERALGFKAGRIQYILDKEDVQYPDWMRSDWDKKPDRKMDTDLQKTLDKDEIEPDI